MNKIIVALICLPLFSNSQLNRDAGLPFLTNFYPSSYINTAADQNWSILQDDQGILYFGNGAGILEYDGVRWSLIPVGKNNLVVRTMLKDKNGRIYTGAVGDVGYIDDDSLGEKKYRSLLEFIPKEYLNFNDIWTVVKTTEGVYFQSREFLFRFTLKDTANAKSWQVKVWKPKTQFLYGFNIDGKYYSHQMGVGLMMMEKDSLIVLPGSQLLANERIQIILPYPSQANEKSYLVGAFNSGLYIYNGQELKPFITEADAFIKNSRLYKGYRLRNGNYAFASSGKGFIIIDKEGKIVTIINQENGLQDELVHDLYEDTNGSIWLALDRGISRLETSSPLTQFTSISGINSGILSIAKSRGFLFAGTGNSLLKLNNKTGIFKKVENFFPSQIFDLLEDDNRLLVATNGLYYIEDSVTHLIQPVASAQFIIRDLFIPKKYPGILFAIMGDNVTVFNRIKEKPYWKLAGSVPGVANEIFSIEESDDGKLWMGTQAQGIFRLSNFSDSNGSIDLTKCRVEIFGEKNGFSNSAVTVVRINDAISFSCNSLIYKFNEVKQQFYVDSILSNVFSFAGKDYSITNDNKGRIWVNNTQKETFLVWPELNGHFKIEGNPFVFMMGRNISKVMSEDDITWHLTSEGLIRYDEKKVINYDLNFKTLIRWVIAGTDTLRLIKENSNSSVGYNKNAFRFEYASTFFIAEGKTKYHTWLEGFEKEGTYWGANSYKEYTNLPEGNYKFHVSAKNVYGKISEAAIYEFTVYPPWFRTWWAYTLYIAVVAIAAWVFIRWRVKKLQKEKVLLEHKVAIRTQQLQKEKEKVESTFQELKVTQAQLIQSAKMASLGELTAGIAHEIQNPLNFVNNFSEVNEELLIEMKQEIDKGNLAEVKVIATDVIENEKKINHHGRRADAIVKNMLQHSAGTTGKRELTDINKLADEYLRLAYQGLRAKDKSFNATLDTDFDHSIEKFEIIPQDVGRVVLNLVSNAFYAVIEKKKSRLENYEPTVSVSTKKTDSKVEIKVKDNGNGVPSEIIEKIFQPFFTTKPAGEGTGLGLSLSYDIVKAHNGELKVDTKDGKGTEFTLVLPAYRLP